MSYNNDIENEIKILIKIINGLGEYIKMICDDDIEELVKSI